MYTHNFPRERDAYLTNVGIVARHRLELATASANTNEKQLEKLCNRGKTLLDLIKEAEMELERVAEYCNKT
jgi:hypothetical protein